MDSTEDSHQLIITKPSLAVLLAVFSAYLLWRVLYRLFFHPLSKIPGPWWARFTRIPYWIANIRGSSIFFMHRLHDKYGPVVIFSPDELSYTDVRAWKDIYGYEKGRSENLKAAEFQYVALYTSLSFSLDHDLSLHPHEPSGEGGLVYLAAAGMSISVMSRYQSSVNYKSHAPLWIAHRADAALWGWESLA